MNTGFGEQPEKRPPVLPPNGNAILVGTRQASAHYHGKFPCGRLPQRIAGPRGRLFLPSHSNQGSR